MFSMLCSVSLPQQVKATPSKQRFPSAFPALRHLLVSFSVLARYSSPRRSGIFNVHKGSVLVECWSLPPGNTLIHISMHRNEAIHNIPFSVTGFKISSFNPCTVHGKARIGVVVYGL